MKVKRVCIVGGGLDGWMVASVVKKLIPMVDVVVVDEGKEEKDGLSESSPNIFRLFFQNLELDDKEWMKECNATYKIANYYKNFKSKDDGGFFISTVEHKIEDFENYWKSIFFLPKVYPKEYSGKEMLEVLNPFTLLGNENKIPKGNFEGLEWNPEIGTGFHFDKNLFKKYIKNKIAMPLGVAEFKGKAVGVEKDEEGYITNLITSSKIKIGSDLYIDCTGEKSFLLKKHMGAKFKSFNKFLPNNKRVSVSIPHNNKEEDIKSYTSHIALKNGWVQIIPLWNKTELNYFYDNKFVNDNEALFDFKEFIKDEFKHITKPPKFIKKKRINQRVCEEPWIKNVIGIGKSMGYLEPLASFDTAIITKNLIQLLGILSLRNNIYSKIDQQRYNNNVSLLFNSLQNYIGLYYKLSGREDSKYWIHNNMNLHSEVHSSNIALDLFSYIPSIITFYDIHQREASIASLSIGMEHYPVNQLEFNFMAINDLYRHQMVKETHINWTQTKNQIITHLKSLPSPYKFLKENMYNLDT
jgi:hypothetical protein